MSTDKRRYDLICSLGGNCSAAFQLQYRNMRCFSLPFDWVYIENDKPIAYLCEGFADGFKNLALKENLIRAEGNEAHPVIYRDTYSGYFFPNHFKEDAAKEYDAFYKKLRRRVDRLIAKIKSARKVLFILSAAFPMDAACLEKLNERLAELFPDVRFDFETVIFGCPAEEKKTIGNIHLKRCVRQQNLYDFYKTNFEWRFLDQIVLPNKSRDNIRLPSFKAFGRRFRLNFEIGRNNDE